MDNYYTDQFKTRVEESIGLYEYLSRFSQTIMSEAEARLLPISQIPVLASALENAKVLAEEQGIPNDETMLSMVKAVLDIVAARLANQEEPSVDLSTLPPFVDNRDPNNPTEAGDFTVHD